MINFLAKTEYPAKVLDKILAYAIDCEAEEIIFEPEEKFFSLSFFRRDEWEKIADLKIESGEEVIKEIKNKARLLAEIKDVSQFGSFKIGFPGYKFIFSVSTSPAKGGERVSIDVDREDSPLFSLKQLGLFPSARARVAANLNSGRRAIFVSAPFNGGKTTALYSFLNFIDSPRLNISTLERQIVHDLPFVNQSLVGRELGYEMAASCVARQDVDVLMIDDLKEIRDIEACLSLAEKGHLVLGGKEESRPEDFWKNFSQTGISLQLLVNSVKMVIYEKLAPKLCPHCLVRHKLDLFSAHKIKGKIDVEDCLRRAREQKIISENISSLGDLNFYKSKGCERCNWLGVEGRIGIFEILEMTTETKELIRAGHFSALREQIKKQGQFTIEEDLFLKAVNGIVDIKELLKS